MQFKLAGVIMDEGPFDPRTGPGSSVLQCVQANKVLQEVTTIR